MMPDPEAQFVELHLRDKKYRTTPTDADPRSSRPKGSPVPDSTSTPEVNRGGSRHVEVSVGGDVGGHVVVGDNNQVQHLRSEDPTPASGVRAVATAAANQRGYAGRDRLGDAELRELADVYDSADEARDMLLRSGLPASRLPSWNASSALEFWRQVARLVPKGVMFDARRRILTTACEDFEANERLAAFLSAGHPAADAQAVATVDAKGSGHGTSTPADGHTSDTPPGHGNRH